MPVIARQRPSNQFILEQRLGQQLLQLHVLRFELLELPGIRDAHAAVPSEPQVEARLRQTALAAPLFDRLSLMAFLQEPDHLFFAESTLNV